MDTTQTPKTTEEMIALIVARDLGTVRNGVRMVPGARSGRLVAVHAASAQSLRAALAKK